MYVIVPQRTMRDNIHMAAVYVSCPHLPVYIVNKYNNGPFNLVSMDYKPITMIVSYRQWTLWHSGPMRRNDLVDELPRPRTDSLGTNGQSNGLTTNENGVNKKHWLDDEDFKIEEEDLETREAPAGGMNYGDYLQVITIHLSLVISFGTSLIIFCCDTNVLFLSLAMI